ncbi:MAG: hypothetical protein A3J40_02840 [Erythrobacter sp. RIFCSPHIGHO2_12_FULL_63_10]|nr:MAG: hypothetical protein A3J40_02840 [Erythrobacter sp. RIFCSPHIGHO2_12_FULL_63_10]
MSELEPRTGASPFRPRAVLAIVLFGAMTFIAMLYFIGAGDFGRRENDGEAHAAANGLAGFAGLARLLELEGFEVSLSRSPSGLETPSLLVLTPPQFTDPEDFSEILVKRQFIGPTLVILPKWTTANFPSQLPEEVQDKVRDGWVRLIGQQAPDWAGELKPPYAIVLAKEGAGDAARRWEGMGYEGKLPDTVARGAVPGEGQVTRVENALGRAIALDVQGADGSDLYEDGYATLFVIEPDLVNNYGLSDRERARLAVELVDFANYNDEDERGVVFDLTLNGFGGTQNLLTLAFRPPFLAATLCLMLALMVIGWRAFHRFGPPLSEGPAIAFGKRRLVANGARLILRARRLRLLAEPYIGLSSRRLGARLGLARPDPARIDGILAARFPDEVGFAALSTQLRNARGPAEILRAARALKELERKLNA